MLHNALLRRLTSIPSVGIRVTISRLRQKAKKSPLINILSIYLLRNEDCVCAKVSGIAVFHLGLKA